MTQPIIGLTTSLTQAQWSVWDAEAAVVDSRYFRAVTEAGGLPVLLPPHPGDAAHILSRLDGLCLIGGPDVGPEFYNTKPIADSKYAPKELDEWNLALMRVAIKTNMPFLAICRGLQLLNVAQGGTLHQHLPDIVGHEQHRPVLGLRTKHPVVIAEGSILEPILGQRVITHTHHHQAADQIGKGLTPIAWADDGIVEGLHLTDHPWGVGVQWHPESEEGLGLMRAFIDNVIKLKIASSLS